MVVAFVGPLSVWYARGGGDLLRLRTGVETWRADLRASVAAKVAQQLEWDEAAPASGEHDLGEAGWLALRLFALYAEHAELELPDTTPPLLEFDQQWRAAADAKFATSKFGHLLACSMWLPGDFPVTLRVPLPDGATAELGSLSVLHDQLRWLNERTFQASVAEVAAWRELQAPAGGVLLDAARRGYAALFAATAAAVRLRTPVAIAER